MNGVLPPEAGCDVRELSLLYAVEALVGGPDVQRSAGGIVGACLEVVEVAQAYLGRQFASTAVPCGADLGVLLHPAGQPVNLGGVLVASHQAKARYSDVAFQHFVKCLGGQRLSHVCPEVLAVAARAVNGAAADADGQGYLVGNLGKDFLYIDVLHHPSPQL